MPFVKRLHPIAPNRNEKVRDSRLRHNATCPSTLHFRRRSCRLQMNDQRSANRPVAQAGNLTFELHTLGWEAFQNLCGHVAREILGQTATVFSPGNDAGQDGAFQGSWQRKKQESFSGRFVIQCKFSSRRDEYLSLGDLKDEMVKAERLASRGLAQTYLLMTNARVTGEADIRIRQEFRKIKGMDHFELFGAEWITQTILESKHLRAFVPRVYGLGDLSQILDERVYRQTDEILQTWRDNLAKFVPTEAHHKSVKALFDQGFVLLLGDPMAGKSTIAAALAIAAADQWKCIPVFAAHPNDFKSHWNPDEPNQFFWVDDAFGQTQFDSSLVEGWNRLFPHLTAAIRKGTKVLFTSRTYIYQAARRELKEAAFPLIRSTHVLIEVENLKLQEKERILYNHLRLGNQPVEFRTAIKPFLSTIAASPKFFPEVARRLGDSFFTKSLQINPDCLNQFVEEPKHFLADIIQQLDRRSYAALALLFMRAGRVAIPLGIEGDELEAVSQLGADQAQLREAMVALEGSLVAQTFEAGEHAWRFRHPSIRDAMAAHVAARPDLLDVYLHGVRAVELLGEVVCGNLEIAGAKVHVPCSRFEVVASKLRGIDLENWYLRYNLLPFLARRCSPDFLTVWFNACRDDFERLVEVCSVANYNFGCLLARLHRSGCLPEIHRQAYVSRAMQEVIKSAESTFLDDAIRDILKPGELETAVACIRNELLPLLKSIVERLTVKYDDIDEEPSDHFQKFSKNLENLRDFFADLDDGKAVEAFECGQQLVEEAVAALEEWKSEQEEEARQKKAEERREKESRAAEQQTINAMIAEYEREGTSSAKPRQPAASPQPRFQMSVPPRSIFDDVDS